MTEDMRALFLVPRPGIRGPIPKITPILISALCEQGCEIATEPWGRRSDRETLYDKAIGRAQDIARIRRSLRRLAPDIMVVTTAHDWMAMSRDIPLLLATRRHCRRIVLHLHGSLSDRLVAPGNFMMKAASAWLLRLSDAALVLSTEELRQWRQFYPGADLHVVANPYVSAGDTPPAFGRATWNLPVNRPVLLFVGRLTEAKGLFDLLQAMPRVLARQACHLFVVGGGMEVEQVRQRIAELGLAGDVTLAGYLEGERLRAAYRLADIFVLPSWAEGFPTVIAEAMDAGLPIVTTRLRGMADHLREGENTLFVPPRNPDRLADALIYLLANPRLRASMGKANRAKVRIFAPDVVAQQYRQLLREIIGRR